MNGLRLVKSAAMSLACWGILVPQTMLVASPKDEAKAPAIADVALETHGTLTGEVLDEQGLALEGAVVSIRQGNEEIAETVASADGRFSFSNLKGGLYQVAAGQGAGVYRLWAPKTAPPSAKPGIRIISQKSVVRGQFGCFDVVTVLTLAASTGAVVTSAIALSKINDVEDKLDNAIAESENLPASP